MPFRISDPARNLADVAVNPAAVLSASSTAAGFSVDNIVLRDAGRKWRGDTNDEWLTFDLGSPQAVHMLGVAGHNLGRDGGGRFQVQASDDGAWADIPYDPGPEAAYFGTPVIHYPGGRVFRYWRIRLIAQGESYAEAVWAHAGGYIEVPSGLAYGFEHEIIDGRVHIFLPDSGYNQVAGAKRRQITGRLSRVTHAVADAAIASVQAINSPVFCDPCQGKAGQETRNRCFGPVFVEKFAHTTSRHVADVGVTAHDLRLDRIATLPAGVDDGLLLSLPLDGAPLPGWPTFSRANSAWYKDPVDGLIKQAAIDAPRYELMPNGLPGIRLDGFGANLLINPEDFSAWTGAAQITTDSDLAPSGEIAADTITDSSATVFEKKDQTVTVPNDTATWVVMLFFKKTGASQIVGLNLVYTGGTTITGKLRFDAFDGSISTDSEAGATVDNFSAAYWRVSLPYANNASGNTSLRLDIYPIARATLNGTDDPTLTGSAVAWLAELRKRAVGDVLGIQLLGNLVAPGHAFSLAVTISINDLTGTHDVLSTIGETYRLVRVYDGVNPWYVSLGAGNWILSGTTLEAAQSYRLGIRSDGVNVSLFTNGLADGSGSETAVIGSATVVGLGHSGGGAQSLYGHMRDLVYYNRYLSDAEMAALTSL